MTDQIVTDAELIANLRQQNTLLHATVQQQGRELMDVGVLLAAAVEDAADSKNVLDSWFNTTKLAHDELAPQMLRAAQGYLRTCRTGGMSQKRSDKIEAAIAGMLDLDCLTAPVVRYVKTQEARIAELEGLVERGMNTASVPGKWCCVKCQFTLLQSTISAEDGTISARDKPGERCPNCDVPLWRVTWEKEATESMALAIQNMDRARVAEDERALQEGIVAELRAELASAKADAGRYKDTANIMCAWAGDVSELVMDKLDDQDTDSVSDARLRDLCQRYGAGGWRAVRFMFSPQTVPLPETQEAPFVDIDSDGVATMVMPDGTRTLAPDGWDADNTFTATKGGTDA